LWVLPGVKILHVAGWSGSGKTTFILDLLTHLNVLGKTGTIKHIHSHPTPLPIRKDTTLHFQSGAEPSVGIDDEKMSAYFHDQDLETSLNLLSDTGVRYAVIEGFKKRPFQKILLGDMDCSFLLKNPIPEDVISIIDRFDDWYTLSGLVKELNEQFPGRSHVTWTGYTDNYLQASELCTVIEKEILMNPAVAGIKLCVHKWCGEKPFPIYLALVLRDPKATAATLTEIMDRLSTCIKMQDSNNSYSNQFIISEK
jgi:molybdopterin-guanine dinucleotide biosynthesis protein MobB